MSQPVDHLVHHDIDDTRDLLELAKQLPDEQYRAVSIPTNTVLRWDGADDSIAAVLDHLVWTKEVWLAAILGQDLPARGGDDPASLVERHEAVVGPWLSMVRDVERRGAWDDRIVDALCDPPESFVLGSILAHVLTFDAHRRQLVRMMLRGHGHEVEHGDPIEWLRRVNQQEETRQ